MQFVKLGACLVLAGFVVLGCAKKRPTPPRGEVVGTIEVEASLADTLSNTYRLSVAKHCGLVVELSEGRGTVVEIGEGECPANNGLIANPIVTLKIWGGWSPNESVPGKDLLLLAGNAVSAGDNVPVGVISTDHMAGSTEPAEFEMTELCTKRINTPRDATKDSKHPSYWTCKLNVEPKDGVLKGITTNRYMTLTHSLVYTETGVVARVGALEVKMGEAQNKLTTLTTNFTALENSLTAYAEGKVAEVKSPLVLALIKGVDAKIAAAITAAKAAIKTEYEAHFNDQVTKVLDKKYALKTEVTTAVAALRTEILAAFNDKDGKLVDKNEIAKAIKGRVDAILAAAKTASEQTFAAEMAKLKLDEKYLKLADLAKKVEDALKGPAIKKLAEDAVAKAKEDLEKSGKLVTQKPVMQALLAAKEANLVATRLEHAFKQEALEKAKGTPKEEGVKKEVEAVEARVKALEAEIKKLKEDLAKLP